MKRISEKPSEKVAMSARAKRVYCTHNEHVTYEKKCIICGKTFTAKSEKAQVCSPKCGYQVKKARKKAAAAIGNITPAQKKAIERAGGVENIMMQPIGEISKRDKILAKVSLFLIAAYLLSPSGTR